MACEQLGATTVEVFKGESRTLRLEVVDEMRTPVDLTGYTVRMTVRRRVKDSVYLFTLGSDDVSEIEVLMPEADGLANIYLAHGLMNSLQPGSYVYDVWLESGASVRFPIVEPNPFIVRHPITQY